MVIHGCAQMDATPGQCSPFHNYSVMGQFFLLFLYLLYSSYIEGVAITTLVESYLIVSFLQFLQRWKGYHHSSGLW